MQRNISHGAMGGSNTLDKTVYVLKSAVKPAGGAIFNSEGNHVISLFVPDRILVISMVLSSDNEGVLLGLILN